MLPILLSAWWWLRILSLDTSVWKHLLSFWCGPDSNLYCTLEGKKVAALVLQRSHNIFLVTCFFSVTIHHIMLDIVHKYSYMIGHGYSIKSLKSEDGYKVWSERSLWFGLLTAAIVTWLKPKSYHVPLLLNTCQWLPSLLGVKTQVLAGLSDCISSAPAAVGFLTSLYLPGTHSPPGLFAETAPLPRILFRYGHSLLLCFLICYLFYLLFDPQYPNSAHHVIYA